MSRKQIRNLQKMALLYLITQKDTIVLFQACEPPLNVKSGTILNLYKS